MFHQQCLLSRGLLLHRRPPELREPTQPQAVFFFRRTRSGSAGWRDRATVTLPFVYLFFLLPSSAVAHRRFSRLLIVLDTSSSRPQSAHIHLRIRKSPRQACLSVMKLWNRPRRSGNEPFLLRINTDLSDLWNSELDSALAGPHIDECLATASAFVFLFRFGCHVSTSDDDDVFLTWPQQHDQTLRTARDNARRNYRAIRTAHRQRKWISEDLKIQLGILKARVRPETSFATVSVSPAQRQPTGH